MKLSKSQSKVLQDLKAGTVIKVFDLNDHTKKSLTSRGLVRVDVACNLELTAKGKSLMGLDYNEDLQPLSRPTGTGLFRQTQC